MSLEQTVAPGSRVRIRGEEWAVEKSLPVSTGGFAVHVKDEVAAASEEEPSDEEGESKSAGTTPEERAKNARAATLKSLTRLAKELMQPRYLRRAPRPVPVRDVIAGNRPKGSVYHWLILDPSMSPFESDKVLAELAPEGVKALKEFRKKLVPVTKTDLGKLQALSDQVDVLYRQAARERERVLDQCRSHTPVWGQGAVKQPVGGYWAIERRDKALALLAAEGTAKSRLKTAMNLWCALWAWPLEEAVKMPDQTKLTKEFSEILGVGVYAQTTSVEAQLTLLAEGKPSRPPSSAPERASDAPGDGIVNGAGKGSALVGIAQKLCERLRPHHWELEFPEVFTKNGGFDLTVGNPPWIKLQWNEQGLLQELDPRLALDGVSASDTAKKRMTVLKRGGTEAYLAECTLLEGTKGFLNAVQNYPLLVGVQTNLYKYFITQGWRVGSEKGIVGLIHQDGIYDDPEGGALRREFCLRGRLVARFRSELRLFADIGNVRPFSFSLSRANAQQHADFVMIANLFHTRTIDESFIHDGCGAVPGIKTDDNEFEMHGHRSRTVRITDEKLRLFAVLFDKKGTPALEARLPLVHSQEVLNVLTKLARHPRRLGDLGDDVFGTEMWHETNSQKDGTIRRDTRFPKDASQWIVSGPHFHVGNPFNKTPKEVCNTHRAYDEIDLEAIPDDYLPRTNYVPACKPKEYLERTPTFKGRPVTEFYRHVHRMMLPLTGERTFAPAIMPPGPGHIHGVVSLAFESELEILAASATWSAIASDFFVRSLGRTNFQAASAGLVPIPREQAAARLPLVARALRLNCLTTHYADLWNRNWAPSTGWSLEDPPFLSGTNPR